MLPGTCWRVGVVAADGSGTGCQVTQPLVPTEAISSRPSERSGQHLGVKR